MLKVAVLGAGVMGSAHARAFAGQPGVKLFGVSSRSQDKARKLAASFGAQAFTDAMSLATHEAVDAVSVTLPTPLHEAYTLAALKAGKHVLVEKPMALTVDACDRMMEAARAYDRVLMVAHVLRFWPEYTALTRLAESGRLGRALSADARRLSTQPAWGEWLQDPELTGGAVHDLQVHDFDVLNWLFGAPKSVYARGRKGSQGGWDHVQALVDYGGASGLSEASFLMPAGYPFTMSLRVLCEGGRVEFDSQAAGTGVETGTPSGTSLMVYQPGREPERLDAGTGDAYGLQIASFVEAARNNVRPAQGTAEQGRAAVRLALAARRSLDSGGVITL